ncbi:MAG: Flp family type IVb pilin [Armatimonadota bacterium]
MVRQRLTAFWQNQEGAGMVEYIIMFALFAVACLLIIVALDLDPGLLLDSALSRLPAGNGMVQPTR